MSIENKKGSSWLFAHQSTVYNGLFVLYLLVLQSPLLNASRAALQQEESVPVLGALILLVIILETFALPVKFNALRFHPSSLRHKDASLNTLGLIWVGHMVVTVFLGMIALVLLGFSIESNSPALALMPILVVKELAMGGFLAGLADPAKRRVSPPREAVANLFLFAFVCVAYTAAWQTFAVSPSVGTSAIELALMIPLALLTFYLLYIPMRFGFFAEELFIADTKRERRWLYASYALAGIAGIWPIILVALS